MGNHGFLIMVYVGVIVVDLFFGVLPCDLTKLKNIVGGFRSSFTATDF